MIPSFSLSLTRGRGEHPKKEGKGGKKTLLLVSFPLYMRDRRATSALKPERKGENTTGGPFEPHHLFHQAKGQGKKGRKKNAETGHAISRRKKNRKGEAGGGFPAERKRGEREKLRGKKKKKKRRKKEVNL